MMGININCKDQDFIMEILIGKKVIETRNTPSLKPYVGKRVGLIRTGKGKAMLMGYATICLDFTYEDEKTFRDHEPWHCVKKGSPYDFKGKKYGYVLDDVYWCRVPKFIDTKGIVARHIPSGLIINSYPESIKKKEV